MTARLRLLLVALLAAAAALPGLLGTGAASPVLAAARSTVTGHPPATAALAASRPAGRQAAGAWDTGDAVAVRRGHRAGAVAGPGHDATVGSAPVTGAAAAVVGSLALVLGWWVRRSVPARVPAGRTTGSRCGRGPPALACA